MIKRRLPSLPRLLLYLLLFLLALVGSGILLADRLTPAASGAPSHFLPASGPATALDREIAPLLAANPGKTGVYWLDNGLDAYAARSVLAQRAGRSLDVMYYIWKDDLPGHLMAGELYQAAERGVRVRLLLDDLNVHGLDPQMLAIDVHPNIEVRVYNPFRNRDSILRLLEMVQRVFSINHRMHNKIWLADNRAVIIGGRNIGAEYFDEHADVNFRDLDLLLAGPAVEQSSRIFDAYWNSAAAVPISALNRRSEAELRALIDSIKAEIRLTEAGPYLQRVRERIEQPALAGQRSLHWSDQVQVLSDPPLKHLDDDRQDWLVQTITQDMARTEQQLQLISPYFVPGLIGAESMIAGANDGLQIQVITNSLAANDVAAVHSGWNTYRESLVDAGIEVFELKRRGQRNGLAVPIGSSGASLHTKAYLVDGRRGFVGSFNLDPRSARLNTEMGVFFDDPVLGARLQQEFAYLADPSMSYRLGKDGQGQLIWTDGQGKVHHNEPDTGWLLRSWVRVLDLLPIESQL